MANPFSTATGYEVFDLNAGGKKIGGGTFDPLPEIAPSFATDAARGASKDVLSTETSRTTSVGTETYTATETKENKVNVNLLSAWMVRIAVVILGFIFVAVGLTMFKPGQTIAVKVKNAVAG